MRSTGPNCSNTSMIAHAIAIINNIDLAYKPLEKPQTQNKPIQPRKTIRNRLGDFFTRKKTMKTMKQNSKNSKNEYNIGHGLVGNFVNRLLELK
jgi:hypothetical protein